MIKIRKAKNGQYYGVIVAKNGKVLYITETMERKRSVYNNINALWRIIVSSNLKIKDETI